MNRQDFYRAKYAKINLVWKDTQTMYQEMLEKLIIPTTKILDIGCGHSTFLVKAYSQTSYTYGIDPDQQALNKNILIKNKFVATGEKLPFEDKFFDLVVSAWVVEHLKYPEKVFSEIYRVLKPGGKVIFLTPNTWNYNVWIIRMIPNRFHSFFTKKLYQREEGDTYPVQYKFNSVKKIHKALKKIGFREGEITLNGDPSYISFNEILFKFAVFLERILNLKIFQNCKVHLLAIFEK